MNLLNISNLTVAFRQKSAAPALAVDDLSFALGKGETLALVGESGSGKSVSALSILRLLATPPAQYMAGKIVFDGLTLLDAAAEKNQGTNYHANLRKVRGNRISMIFQEPMTSLNPLHNVGKQVGEALRIHQGIDGKQAKKRVLELLERVALQEPTKRFDAFPHELSGGQRQRVMIAMALANNPDLLIADEPTTALDVVVQAQILQLLQEIQRDTGMALLLITHDLGVVKQMAGRILVMHRGKLIEQGDTETVMNAPEQAHTRDLIAANLGLPGPVAEHDENAPPLLAVKQLRVTFTTRRGILRRATNAITAVRDVSLHVQRGETLGIVGESGSGKTTLALALLRLLPAVGQVVFQGRDIMGLRGSSLRKLRAEMQIVFQDPWGSLSPRLTVGEIIAEGLAVHQPSLTPQEIDARVRAVLHEVSLAPDMADRWPHEFSGGQRQRIALARALILQPALIILDEPTSALDRSVQMQIVTLLRDLQQKHSLAYIFVSHDLRVVRALAHRIIVMKDGTVVEEGTTAKVLANPQETYTKILCESALI